MVVAIGIADTDCHDLGASTFDYNFSRANSKSYLNSKMKQIQQVNNVQTAMVDVWQVQSFEILMITCIGQVFILGLMVMKVMRHQFMLLIWSLLSISKYRRTTAKWVLLWIFFFNYRTSNINTVVAVTE